MFIIEKRGGGMGNMVEANIVEDSGS